MASTRDGVQLGFGIVACDTANSHLCFSQVFEQLVELVTSCGNYSRYRQRFSQSAGFRFPILGVHLNDLIAVHVALSDWADPGDSHVNLAKTQPLYVILPELAQIQTTPAGVASLPGLTPMFPVGWLGLTPL